MVTQPVIEVRCDCTATVRLFQISLSERKCRRTSGAHMSANPTTKRSLRHQPRSSIFTAINYEVPVLQYPGCSKTTLEFSRTSEKLSKDATANGTPDHRSRPPVKFTPVATYPQLVTGLHHHQLSPTSTSYKYTYGCRHAAFVSPGIVSLK